MTRIVLPTFVLLCTACGGSDTDGHDHAPAVDTAAVAAGCDHFSYGPEEALTASDGTTNHSHIHPHVRVALTLPEGPEGNVAFIHLHPEGAPEGYLLLSAVVPVTAVDEAGAPVAPLAEVRDDSGCESAALVLHYALPTEGLFLEIGPTDVESLTLVSHVVGATAEGDADAHVHEHELTESADAALDPESASHTH
jgi:hypothetical protein